MADLNRAAGVDTESVRNPEQQLQTYHVYVVDTKLDAKLGPLLTHHYSIEECALWIKDNLKQPYILDYIVQPDSKLKLTKAQIEEL